MRCMVAVVLLLLCSCEKATTRELLWHAPKIGDRSHGTTNYTATIDAGGTKQTVIGFMEIDHEILAVDGEIASRERVTVVRDGTTIDGVTRPGVSGTFEITHHGDDAVEVTKPGATLSDAERAFFNAKPRETRASADARKHLLEHTFKAGDRYALSTDEIIGLGYGAKSITLVAKEIAPTRETFQVTFEGDLAGGLLHATGVLELTPRSRSLVQDGTISKNGTPMGTLHLEQRASY